LILRQFIGNPEMGWKVAWSDRMVSMFTSIWIFGLIWYPFRRRLPAFPLWAWGSFNSLMRLLTGIFFGLGIVWFGFPYLNDSFAG
jgi:hypothetical protein